MAREIKAGILLELRDQFSSQIRGAGISVQGFADKAVGVADKINHAFSGVAGTLGTLGVSIGALSAIKSTIDLDDRMVRLGLTANASAQEINDLKRQIFETAQMPDIKLDTDSIISGLEVVMEKIGDLQFVQDNVRNIALAIQASGESGDAMGAVFSEFAKFGYTMEEILPLMDDLIAQGDQGAFTFGEFAKNAPAVFSAYSAIGTTPEHIRKANAAMQILMAGTKSADIAVTALNSTMNEMSDPDKQNKLRMMGINVRDMATGEFRDFNDIMFDIVARAKEMGNADYFGTIFGNFSMNAIRAYMTQGERMYDSLVNLGDTAGLLEQKSATMANTLKSNFQNLQTAFLAFADKNLTGPLQDLTNLLNKLAEDPEKIEAAIRGIALAIGAIAAVRIGAGIVSFIANLTRIKSGGGLDVSSLTNTGAGIPVYVTNLGGTASLPVGSMGLPGMQPRSGLVDQYGNPLSSPTNTSPVPNKSSNPLENSRAAVSNLTAKHYIGSAATAGIGAAIIEIPQMINELHGIDQDDTLTNQERGEAKGGAIGDAAGSIIGAAAGGAAGIAAGAAVGAAVGSVVPILGTAVGALVGAGIGALGMWLGGKAGRAVGTAIGGAVAGDDETAAQSPETIYNNSVVANPEIVNNTTLPRGQYSDDYIYTPPDSASPFSAGISNLNNWYQTTQGTPSIVQYNNTTTCPQAVNDLIITPQGQFNTHPDDYIFAMKDPATLLNSEIRNEVRTVEHIPPAIPPVVVEGEIELRSELTIDDKSYRLKQSAGKNTTPYKFAVGNATTARLIQ